MQRIDMACSRIEEALLQRCRDAADIAASRAAALRCAADEDERIARALMAEIAELQQAREIRRHAALTRWRHRQQVRQAKALLQSAQPLHVAGRGKGIRGLDRLRAQELVDHWCNRAAQLPTGCGGPGVYALFDGNELVYIGKASNVAARIGQHFNSKQFTAASYVSVPRDRLDQVERMLLDVFMPRMNRDSTTVSRRRDVARCESP